MSYCLIYNTKYNGQELEIQIFLSKNYEFRLILNILHYRCPYFSK